MTDAEERALDGPPFEEMADAQLVDALAQKLHTTHAEALELLALAQEALDLSEDDYTDADLFRFAESLHEAAEED